MEPVIQLEGLSVRLGARPILKGLNASIGGRSIGLLGPNGAGKSTLINTLLGFHAPTEGTAKIFGKDIRTHANYLRGLIGYMPESDSFIANMSGLRFVRYMAELSGLPAKEALERAHEAFFYVGLGEARYRNVGTYSLGMKQLTKLAQAIAHGPKLLFLDEPTNGLDPPARLRMIQLIKEIRATEGMHLIVSSHLLRDVEECCEQVLILKDGMIMAYLDLEEERKGNRMFLDVETVGLNESFVSGLESLGCECGLFNAGRMKLVLPPQVGIRDLYSEAARHNVQLRKMSYRRDSLEDIFLRSMQGTEANGAGHAATNGASSGRL